MFETQLSEGQRCHLIQYFNGDWTEQYKGMRYKGWEEGRVNANKKETIPR